MSIQAPPVPMVALAEGGANTPFITLRTGAVHSRGSGKLLADITGETLDEMVRVFHERYEQDPVIIDWQHSAAPGGPPSAPDISNSLGRIVDMRRVGDAIEVTPRYNPRGLAVVKAADGDLWSSPLFLHDRDIYARDGGELVGRAQMIMVTLTPCPQQVASAIDAVRLNEAPLEAQEESGMTPEEIAALEAERDELKAMVAELEAKLAAMADDADEMSEGAEASAPPAVAALREQLDDRTAEATSLREQMGALTTELTALREENYVTKRTAAIDALVSAGKVTPAEREAAERAYDVEFTHPKVGYKAFTEHFANRDKVVVTGVLGTGASQGAGEQLGAAEAVVALREKAEAIRSAMLESNPHADVSLARCIKRAETENPDIAAAARL